MTNAATARMLWGAAMKLRSSLCAIAILSLGGAHCEPLDEAPPASPPPRLPPPPASDPASAPAEGAPSTDDEGYASGEVAIGAESSGYDDDDPAALTDFHSTLDAHGAWVDDPTYGTVWVPREAEVGKDFQPYVSGGHWVYDDDWVWVSDYDWGWAPFHYGRWVWIDGRGWVWIPGRVYRGAWVAWGVDDGFTYVGWAPLPPSFVWFGGVAVGFPIYVGPRWVYCPHGEVFFPPGRRHVVSGAAAAAVAGHVRPYVPAAPGVAAAAPSPQQLGFHAAEVPHAGGAEAAAISRAQEFSRPTTAQAVGAHAPTRLAPVAPSAVARVPPGAGSTVAHPTSSLSRVPSPALPASRSVLPASPSGPAVRGSGARSAPQGVAPAVPGQGVAPAPARTYSAPAPRSSGTRAPAFHGGGSFGGGGHHR